MITGKWRFLFYFFFQMREVQICLYAKETSRERGCLKVQKTGVMTNEQDLSREVGKGRGGCGMDPEYR